MLFLKKVGKSLTYTLVVFLLLTILLTVLNYFNIFKSGVTNIFKIVNLIIAILAGSIILGHNSQSKGWLEGLKFGGLFGILLFLFNYLGLNKFNVLVYVIVIGVSTLGGMIGISFKKN